MSIYLMQNRAKNIIQIWITSLLLIVVSGCVYIPTPEHGTVSERGKLTPDSLKQLVAEQNSRSDVLLLLGEPSSRKNEDKYFYFSWAAIQGYFVIAYAGTLDVPNMHVLVIEFSDDARLSRYKLFESGLFGDLEDLERAIEKWKTDA